MNTAVVKREEAPPLQLGGRGSVPEDGSRQVAEYLLRVWSEVSKEAPPAPPAPVPAQRARSEARPRYSYD
jgi:hypothetical protein